MVTMVRENQFRIIESARKGILDWASEHKIPLHCVEFVVPFVPSDMGLTVWLFYESNSQLHSEEAIDWSRSLQTAFLSILREHDYPEECVNELQFAFDSDENVQSDYEGNYFYRLR